jgi:hypothetical protein
VNSRFLGLTNNLLFVAILFTGCTAPTTAVINGRTVPRPNLGYTDRYFYGIKHERAYPDPLGPSSGIHTYDGRIVGRVCGVDVMFESEYWGQRLDVSGFASRALPGAHMRHVRFDVRTHGDERTIFGSFAGAILPIEIYFKPGSITGTVGMRRFKVDQYFPEYDELRGTVKLQTLAGWNDAPFVVRGIRELWAMPAADQAVLLPFMMSCLEGMPGPGRTLDAVLGIDFSGRGRIPQAN